MLAAALDSPIAPSVGALRVVYSLDPKTRWRSVQLSPGDISSGIRNLPENVVA
jgi:hypothetical protein